MSFWQPVEDLGTRPLRSGVVDIGCAIFAGVASLAPFALVAHMTGNVVFLAFALAGAHGFSLPAVVVALAAFGRGALAGGALGSRLGRHRGKLLSATAAAQALLLTAAVVIAALPKAPCQPATAIT